MKISLQIALGYFLIVGLAAWFVLMVFSQEVKPGVREAMEDTLVDTANLLAEQASRDFQSNSLTPNNLTPNNLTPGNIAPGNIARGTLAQSLNTFKTRPVDAAISGINKRSLEYRVYITDAHGIVVYSTEPEQIGKDFSQWRDVYLTLRGEYGARSSRDYPDNDRSSVMHVAAPILAGGRIVGALTVAKPYSTVQPFVERSEKLIRNSGFMLLSFAALIGIFFTWRLTRAIGRLRAYAQTIAQGGKAPAPTSNAVELADLGRAIDTMREKLEGKHYVERYVHTLTHELKSPLAAIRGAAELLEENHMPEADRQRFLANIREQSDRLSEIADKMLSLAQLEQMQKLENPAPVDLGELLRQSVAAFQPRMQAKAVTAEIRAGHIMLNGDAFLLRQALENLLDNALQFSPQGGAIEISLTQGGNRVLLEVRDRGPGVPDYALGQVFERFFSLPRPGNGKKSTGLGLSLVREVANLHGGQAGLDNDPAGGVCAWMTFAA
ncbi:MAG: two-component system sensor histidine kinase CreC [Gallionella sp.]|nr:two-component system sensor histidine kinase CreC [Gallionella sp.]